MVEERPSSPKFFTVTSFFLVVLVLQFSGGWTAPQIPNDQYQPNIYIPQAPTDFSHPSEAGREYSQPTAPAVNHVPLQEEHHNERPDYENQPNEEDYINPADRPRGRPYAGSFAEDLDGVTGEEDPEKSIPGSPEQDYPVFEEIPRTSFSCRDKPVPAYYADVEARCQVFHICDVGGHKHSFLCPNGSVFNQKYLVCDWWYDFACENAENLFSKQLLDATTTTPNDRHQTFSDAAQTFSNDGQLIYSQNPTGDYNLNQGFLNPGLPQTQLDTPQQVYTGNYYVPQNDIFHGAETGFPGRDLIHANSENARKNDENNANNTGNVNTNNVGSNNDNNYNNNVANLNTGNANLNNGNVNNNANLNNGNVNNANSNNGEFNNGNFNNGNANNGNLNHENVNIGSYNTNENSNNGNLNYGGNSNGGNFNNGNANFNTRDLNSAGSNQGNLNNENLNIGNVIYNKENFNSTNNNNFNNQNVNKNGEQIYNTGNSNSKNQARTYIEGKSLDNFQNRQDEPPRNRKQYKVGRRRHDNNSKQSTTQSSLNTGEKIPDKTQVYPEKVHSNPVGTSVGEIHEQGPKNIVNDTVALQRNNNENNFYNNEQRTESNGNSFQANVNSFSQPQPNTQYIPQNTFREANNNFQTNQYTI